MRGALLLSAMAVAAIAAACASDGNGPTGPGFAHDTIELADLNNVPLPAIIGESAGDTTDVAGGFVAGAFVAAAGGASSGAGPCTYILDIGRHGASGNSLSTVTGDATCSWFATWHAEATFSVNGQVRRFDFIAPQYR